MSHPFLLNSSYSFENSSDIEDIRQSIIDINKETIQQEVFSLLKKAILKLGEDIQIDLANELFQLILSCFSKCPKTYIPAFESLFKRSKNNSYFLICSFSVLAYLVYEAKCLSNNNYSSLASEALDEVFPQMKFSDKIDITIFQHKIPTYFKLDLLTDLLLCAPLTEDYVSIIFPFIISNNQKNSQKYSLLVEKVKNASLLKSLPASVFLYSNLFENLSNKEIIYFLPQLPKQTFIRYFSYLSTILEEQYAPSRSFVLDMIKKCIETDKKFPQMLTLFKVLEPSDFTPEICEYLKKYKFTVPHNLFVKFSSIEDKDLLLQIVQNINQLPIKWCKELLLKGENYDVCKSYLIPYKSLSKDLMTMDFLKHLYKIFGKPSLSDPYSELKGFVNYFNNLVANQDVCKLIDEIIFSSYPPTMTQSIFLQLLVNSLPKPLYALFFGPPHQQQLVSEIIAKNILPRYEFMNILDAEVLYDMIQTNENLLLNPIVTYAYLFSRKKLRKSKIPLKKVSILPAEDDPKSFSLLTGAIAFLFNPNETKILGLTKENIFIFISNVFRFIEFRTPHHLLFCDDMPIILNQPKMITLIKEAIDYFTHNDLPDMVNHINLAISPESPNLILSYIFDEISIKDFVIKTIMKKGFSKNQKFIFNLLYQNNHRIPAVQFIINNLNHFDYRSITDKIYLNQQDIDQIEYNIQDESKPTEFIINNILFIYHLSANVHNFTITKSLCLEKAFTEMIQKNLLAETKIIRDIMIKNHFLIQYKNIVSNELPNIIQEKSEEEILTSILECHNLENDTFWLDALFNKMLQEESNLDCYLHILVEMIPIFSPLTPLELINICINEYLNYDTKFFKAIDLLIMYHIDEKVFIIRPEPKPIELLISDKGCSIVSRLFKSIKENELNYQAFICLKSIACTFPFLLDQNPQLVFDSVVSAFDLFELVFSQKMDEKEQEEIRIKKVKTAISALSFIIASLNSIKILDSFIIWLFSMIETFTNSQILCFNLILLSIFRTCHKKILLSSLIKYNILDVFISLSHRNIPDGLFKKNFNHVINLILLSFFQEILDLNKNESIMIDEYLRIENPFEHYFKGHLTVFPEIIKSNYVSTLITDPSFDKNIFTIIDDIEKRQHFWFDENYIKSTKYADDEIAAYFMKEYHDNIKLSEKPLKEYNKLDVHKPITVEMVRYLSHQYMWIFNWFLSNCEFPIFPQHYMLLTNAVENMNKNSMSVQGNQNLNCFDKTKCFLSQYMNRNYIMNIILNNNFEPSTNLKSYFQLMINKHSIDCFIDAISECFDERNFHSPASLLTILNYLIDAMTSRNIKLINNEASIIKLVSIASQVQYRSNKDILMYVYKLIDTASKLPEQATQFVNFMFMHNNELIKQNSWNLVQKFTKDQICHFLLNFDFFIKTIRSQNPDFDLVSNFIKSSKEIALMYSPELCDALSILMKNTNMLLKSKRSRKNNTLIMSLMNFITPNRTISTSFISASVNFQLNTIEPKFNIPPLIYILFPKFFDLVVSYYDLIEEILYDLKMNKSDLKLFSLFPEIIPFRHRFNDLRKGLSSKMKGSKQNLHLLSSHLLEGAFEAFSYDKSLWEKPIRISYIDMPGIDAGGLRKDWFTNVAKELFDPDTKLFCFTGTNFCLQPDPFSNKKEKYIEYFEFAGKFLARILIEGICINAHFTRAFLKQILGRSVSLKDLEYSEKEVYNSMKSILETDFDADDSLELYFEVTNRENQFEMIPLKENGSNIRVTNQNKDEYVNLVVMSYLRDPIIEQIRAFCRGFSSIISYNDIKLFSSNEFNFMIVGVSKIDVQDWKRNATTNSRNSPVFDLFFECISTWNNEDLSNLLLFITGSSQVPPGGFSYYKDIGNPIRIRVVDIDPSSLPISHTCFNTIDIPPYTSVKVMNEKLRTAINECEGFQMD